MASGDEAIIARVRTLTEPVITDVGIELVDIEYGGGRGGHILRFLIDKPSGVTLDECVMMNKKIAEILDIEEPIPHRYTLEVSSPGMDRPLKTVRDFERAAGKRVKIITSIPIENTTVHVGRLEACEPGTVMISVSCSPNGQYRSIPLDVIQKAHREVEWK